MGAQYLCVISAILLAGTCASNGPPERQGRAPSDGLNQSRQLLAHARSVRAEQGCAKAIPAYRVISSFGDGYDVAQFELGACLVETDGATANETALFREEGVFWLKRAAWAGNARAQGQLAQLLSGAETTKVTGVAPVPVEAMGWALVYRENSARDLYNLPPVSIFVLDHLKATLSPEEAGAAAAFAEDFDKIKMASFSPPARRQNAHQAQGERRRPPGGQGRRRR